MQQTFFFSSDTQAVLFRKCTREEKIGFVCVVGDDVEEGLGCRKWAKDARSEGTVCAICCLDREERGECMRRLLMRSACHTSYDTSCRRVNLSTTTPTIRRLFHPLLILIIPIPPLKQLRATVVGLVAAARADETIGSQFGSSHWKRETRVKSVKIRRIIPSVPSCGLLSNESTTTETRISPALSNA